MSERSKSFIPTNTGSVDKRALIAHECRCLALIQAGLVLLLTALVAQAALGQVQIMRAVTAGIALLIAASTLSFVLAFVRAIQMQSWISQNDVADASCWGVVIISMTLTVGAVATAILFWLF